MGDLVVKLCTILMTPWTIASQAPLWDFPGTGTLENTGVGCHFLLQGIFPTEELNPGLLHCRQIFYQVSCKGSLHKKSHSVTSSSLQPPGLYSSWSSPGKNMGVGTFPFSRGSAQPRDRTQVSHIAGGFFTS